MIDKWWGEDKTKPKKRQKKQPVTPQEHVDKEIDEPNNKNTVEKRSKGGQFLPGNVAGSQKGKGSKALKRKEYRNFLAQIFDVDGENKFIDLIMQLSDEDPKIQSKIVDIIGKRLPKRKAPEKRTMNPIVEELLKKHMPHLLIKPIEDS